MYIYIYGTSPPPELSTSSGVNTVYQPQSPPHLRINHALASNRPGCVAAWAMGHFGHFHQKSPKRVDNPGGCSYIRFNRLLPTQTGG